MVARSTLAATAASRKPAEVEPAPVAVKTIRLAPETLTQAVRQSGNVKEWQKADLSFRENSPRPRLNGRRP